MLRSVRNLKITGIVLLLLCCFNQTAKAQAPIAAFDANDTIVCISNTVSFIDMSIPGSAAITAWSWTFGDGGLSSAQNPNYAYSAGGNYTVTLIVTDANGAKDTATKIIYVLVAQAIQNTVRICSPQSTTSIFAVDPNIAGVTGTWFTSSSGVIATPANDTTVISNLVSGTYLFFWVVSDGTCSAADQVTVIVDQPVPVNAGPDQFLCTNPGTTTMAAANPAPGTGVWTTSSSAIIANPVNRNTTISGLNTPATYVFIWTVTNGACVNRDTMNIVVSNPVTANAGVDQNVCASPGTTSLNASSPSPGTGMWTSSSSATITNPTSASASVSGLTNAGVYTFIWTVTNGACVSRDTMLITVTNMVVALAGNDRQICTSTASGLLSGNNPAPGTGVWIALNGGVIVTPNSNTSNVTGLTSPGFYNFVWTITNGPCVSRDTVVFIVRNPVIANAGLDQQICNATTATLTGNSPAPGTALWTTTGSATFATPTSATTTVSGLVVGLNTFIYTTTYGACVSRDTIVIRIDALILANAGPDIQICETQTTVTMAGNNPAPGTGLWTKLNGGTITTPTSPTTTITALTPGNHVFIWTITNGTCLNRDTMRITVNVQIPSNAGLDQQVCQGSIVALSGNNPLPATGLWSTNSSAIIASPSSSNTTVSGMTNAGVYVFVWTVTNGACVLRDSVRITIDSAVVSNAGPDQNLCAVTTSTLAGNSPAPGTGLWTSLGTATIANASSANSAVSNLVVGNNLFVWTITNGNCISRDTINIIISTLIPANAGPDQQICASSPTATLSGNSPVPGSGTWSTSSSATIANANNPSTSVSGLSTAGNYDFIWIITNGACISRDTVRITVTIAVLSNAGPDQNLCAVTISTLAGNSPAPGTGIWTSLGAATIAIASSANSAVSNLAIGNNLFVWTITNGACISSDTINIVISTLIPANAGPDQQICASSPTATLSGNSPAPGSGTWSTSSSATIANANNPSTSVSGLSTAGNYDFIWTITNGACISRDTVRITVTIAVLSNAGPDQNLCAVTTSTLAGNSPAPGTGLWTSLGAATIASASSANSAVSNLAIGNNLFVWNITNGACISSDTINIIIDNLVSAIAGSDQQVCLGTLVALSGNIPSSGNGTWTALNGGTLTSPSASNSGVTGLSSAGNYSFVWTITNGACISQDTVVITVNQNEIADAGSDQNLCETFTTNLNAQVPSLGSGVWTSLGAATISTPSSPTSAVNNLAYGANQFVWTLTNGSCVNSDTMTVFVDSIILANAGSDQQVCAASTMALSANSTGSGVGTWTSLGAAIVDDVNNPASTVSNLQTGSNVFVWIITNGTCTSTDTINIQIHPLPIADAGADQFVSTGTLVTLGGAPAASGGASPYTYVWTPGQDLSDSLIANPTLTATVTTTFLLTVTDSLGCTANSSITIWVNDPPVLIGDTVTTAEDTAIVIYVLNNDSDPNNNLDTNSLAVLQGPFFGTVTIGPGGVIIYTPGPNFNGIDSVLYTICDDGMPVYCDSTWVIITVTPVNDAPMLVDDYATTPEDSCIQIAILSNDSDVENMLDLSTLVIISGPSNGTFVLDPITGILTYCPDSNFNGMDTLIYAMCDSGFPQPILCDTALVIITITPVNDAPIALNDSAIVCAADVSIINVLANDFDQEGDSLSVSILNQGSQGIAFVSLTNEIIYTANAGSGGWDSLQYVICDQGIPVGCDTAWVYVYIHPLAQITSVVTNVLCNGDSIGAIDITLNPTGTYAYSWSNGSSDEDIDSLFAGIYTVSIIDSNGCVLTHIDTVQGPLLPLVAVTVKQDVLCFGEDNGTIDLQVGGGTLPYTYVWNNASSDEDLDSLAAGIYLVMITDSNGCTFSISDTIIAPSAPLVVIMTSNDISCYGDSSGFIHLAVSGGTPGYTYNWNNGATTDSLNALLAGVYTVQINDTNGCALTLSDTIAELSTPIMVSSTVVDPYCFANTMGSIQTLASGGFSPYTYLWSTNDTTTSIDSLTTGFYQLLITDSAGCVLVSSYNLVDSSAISITLTGANVFCEGESAVLNVDVHNGFSYQWLLSGAPLVNDTLTQLWVTQSGDYEVTASSGCGVLSDGPLTITVNSLPNVDAGMDENVACHAALTLNAAGANSYSWLPANLCVSPNSAATVVNTSSSNTYFVIGTDLNGCTAMDSVVVSAICNDIVIPTGFSPNGDGFNDYFVITDIDQYPNANLRIFNRWGNLVYEMDRYDNTWNGFSNVEKIKIGEVLPNGTYYYILDLKNDEKPLNGFVVIRR